MDEDDDVVVTLPMADLSLTKSVVLATDPSGDLDGSGSITVGDIVDFEVTVSNAGPDLATGVIVTDELPDGFAYLSDSSGGNYDFNNGQWNVGAITAGDSKSIVIRAQVTNTGNYTNVAQVTASGVYDPDSTPNNNDPDEDDYFTVTPTLGLAADLELDKVITGFNDLDSSGGLSPGDEVIFLLTLTNNGGPDPATGVTVRDQLGAGFTYASHSGDGTYDPVTGLWTPPSTYIEELDESTDPGTVLPDQVFTLQIIATVLGGFEPADYVNYAQVWTSEVWDPDSTPGDNSTDQDDDALAVLQVADLSITKTNNQSSLVPGLPTTYTIVVTNQGPANVAGAVVQDTFPAALLNPTYTSIVVGTGSGNTASGSGSIFDVVSLMAGSSIVYTVTGTVSPSATGTLSNTATVTSPPNIPDLDPSDNTATDTDPLTPRADLSIVKTDGQTTSTPGTSITYTIVVNNNGPSNVTGASIQDLFPPELLSPSYVSIASGGASGNTSGSGDINDTVNMPVGSQILYIVSATVSPSATGTLTNTATVSPPPGTTDPNPGNNLSTDTNTLLEPPSADLGVLKNYNLLIDADGSASITPGDTLTFEIIVFNAGPDAATGIVVQDVVPSGYTVIPGSITGGGVLSGNTITWSGLSLSATPGLNSLTLTFNATVTSNPNYTNPVQIVSANQNDPNPSNNQTTVTPPVEFVSDLSLVKSVVLLIDADASGNLSAGDTVRFSVVLSNAGPAGVTNVVVEDLVPAGYTGVTNLSHGGIFNSLTDTITWSGLSVAAGSSTTLLYDAVILGGLAAEDYSNYAQVVSSPNWDPDSTPGNGNGVTPVEDDEASTRPTMSDLSLTKEIALINDMDGSGGYSGGDTVQFTLTVSNAGPDPANGVSVQDNLPAGYNWISGGSYNSVNRIITWTGLNVPVAGTATVTFTATLVPGQPIAAYNNYAQIRTSPNFDPDSVPGDNSVGDDDDDTVRPPISDLSLGKSYALTIDEDGSGSVTPGDTITFTVVVTNHGPDDATNVRVVDEWCAGFNYVSDDAGGSFNSATGEWIVGDLANGATATLQITMTVNEVDCATNFAQITSSSNLDPDSTPNNGALNEDDDVTLVVMLAKVSDLSLDKNLDLITDADNSGGYSVGDTVRFTLTVTNGGPDAATGVQVEDQLPPGFMFLNYSGNGTYNPSNGIWTVGTIGAPPSLNTATLQINALIVAGNPAAGDYTNYAEIHASDNFDPNSTPHNNSTDEDDDDTVALPVSDLSLTKSLALAPDGDLGNDGRIDIGDTVRFTLSVINNGPDGANGVSVQDLVPAGYSVVPASITDGGLLSGSTITWTDLDLTNAVYPYSLQLTFDAVVVGGQVASAYTNYAQITASPNLDPDSRANNNSTTEDDDATAAPLISDLSLTKVLDPALTPPGVLVDADSSNSLSIGDTVQFVVTVSNAGPDPATGVVVTDQLPSGYTYVGHSVSTGSYVPATGVWTVGGVGVSGSQTLTLWGTMLASGNYTNTAEVTDADNFDPDSTPGNNDPTEDDQASLTPAVGAVSNLSLVKSVAIESDTFPIGSINAGDTVRFTVTVSNAGPSVATGVAVQDVVPTGYSSVTNISDGGTLSGSNVDWIGLTIPVGGNVALTFDALVLATGDYTNYAQVTASDNFDPDSTPGNNSTTEDDDDTLTPVVVPVSDLSLVKSIDFVTDTAPLGSYNAGDVVQFSLTVSNAGPNEATGVAVQDAVPSGYTNIGSINLGGTLSGSNVNWSGLTIPAGNFVTLTFEATIAATGDYANYAQITASDNVDPNSTPGNNSTTEDDDDTLTPTIVPVSDLSLTKVLDPSLTVPGLFIDADSNNEISIGDTIAFVITVSNAGPNDATGVEITDQLPSGYVYASHSVSAGTYDDTTGLWTVGVVQVGLPQTLTLRGVIQATGDYTNTAEVTASDNFDPNSTPDNNDPTEDDQDSVTPPITEEADLSLTKSLAMAPGGDLDGSGGYSINDLVQFTITVTNAGPAAASGVVVQEQLPSGYTYVSDDAGGAYNSGTGFWTIGNVANGSSATLVITASINATGDYTNYAQVWASNNPDPNSTPGNNSTNEDDDDTAALPIADLSLNKLVSDSSPLVGSPVTFTLVVSNAGPDTATNVQVADLLPSGYIYVSGTIAGGDLRDDSTPATGDGLMWTINTLAAGFSVNLTYQAVPLAVGNYTNYAQITAADQFDPNSTPGNGPQTPDEDDDATLTVYPFNDTQAVNDINQTPMNVPVGGNVLTNDVDAQGHNQTVTSALADTDGDGLVDDALTVGTPTAVYGTDRDGNVALAGTITLNADGTYTYVPAANFTGTLPLEYTITDDNVLAATDSATLSIKVFADYPGVNDPPVALGRHEHDEAGRAGVGERAGQRQRPGRGPADGDGRAGGHGRGRGGGRPGGCGCCRLRCTGRTRTGTWCRRERWWSTRTGRIRSLRNRTSWGRCRRVTRPKIRTADGRGGADDHGGAGHGEHDGGQRRRQQRCAGPAAGGNVLSNDFDPEGDNQTVTSALADTDGDGLADDPLTIGVPTAVYGLDGNGNRCRRGRSR
jgi:large repetitive protein